MRMGRLQRRSQLSVAVSAFTSDSYAEFLFIWNGYAYEAELQRGFTQRGLITKARQFAKEIVARSAKSG